MTEQTESISPGKRFWRLLKPDQKEITNIYVYAVFSGLVNLSLPLGIQAIINQIQGARMSTSWVVLVIIVILGITAAGILQIQQLKITERLQQRIFTRAAFEFAYRIPRIKLESLYQHYAPELINRFFDIVSVQKGLSKMLIDFSVAGLQVAFGLILLSLYHPFFIAFSLVLIVLVYAIFRFTVEKGLDTSLKESKYKYQVAYWLQELARTNSTFKLAGKTNLPLERIDAHTTDYLGARENHFKILVQQYSLMVVFKVIVAAGLLVIGSILVMDQKMNIGQFVAAEIIILLIMGSVEKLIVAIETIYDVLTSLEKIAQVTDMDLENHEGIDLESECGDCGLAMSFQDLSFKYPGKKIASLKNINLQIESDEKIIVVGANTSGKSSLLQIMAGLFEPQDGSISFNEIPKSNLQLESLRSVIGDSLSQEQLFQGTLRENISMGREQATFENLKWAVANLGLDTYVKSLAEGYDTILDSEGKKIPRSIVQKILLARSIADRPKLLLLEDSFEHLDPEDRTKIVDFLTDRTNRWTLVAVSSDSYLASKCDRVLVMKDGGISMTGTYSDLKEIIKFKPMDNA